MLDEVVPGSAVLVGSSMGGWRMLLVTLARPERICGPVGLASAPDFARDLIAARRTPNDRARLERDGMLLAPSDYGDPIPITRRLLDDGEEVALPDVLTFWKQHTAAVRPRHGS